MGIGTASRVWSKLRQALNMHNHDTMDGRAWLAMTDREGNSR
jgi:hypothetical protein